MPAPTKSEGTVSELIERASGAQKAVSDALALVTRVRGRLDIARNCLERAKSVISKNAYPYRGDKSYHQEINDEIEAINKLLGDRP